MWQEEMSSLQSCAYLKENLIAFSSTIRQFCSLVINTDLATSIIVFFLSFQSNLNSRDVSQANEDRENYLICFPPYSCVVLPICWMHHDAHSCIAKREEAVISFTSLHPLCSIHTLTTKIPQNCSSPKRTGSHGCRAAQRANLGTLRGIWLSPPGRCNAHKE